MDIPSRVSKLEHVAEILKLNYINDEVGSAQLLIKVANTISPEQKDELLDLLTNELDLTLYAFLIAAYENRLDDFSDAIKEFIDSLPSDKEDEIEDSFDKGETDSENLD